MSIFLLRHLKNEMRTEGGRAKEEEEKENVPENNKRKKGKGKGERSRRACKSGAQDGVMMRTMCRRLTQVSRCY